MFKCRITAMMSQHSPIRISTRKPELRLLSLLMVPAADRIYDSVEKLARVTGAAPFGLVSAPLHCPTPPGPAHALARHGKILLRVVPPARNLTRRAAHGRWPGSSHLPLAARVCPVLRLQPYQLSVCLSKRLAPPACGRTRPPLARLDAASESGHCLLPPHSPPGRRGAL